MSVLAGGGVAVPFVLSQNASLYLDRADTWRSLILGVVSIALWALIGLAVGLLIRNFVVALLVGIGFSYLVEPTLSAVLFVKGWTGPLNLLPSGATNAMLGLNSPVLLSTPDPWPWWAGLLVLLRMVPGARHHRHVHRFAPRRLSRPVRVVIADRRVG